MLSNMEKFLRKEKMTGHVIQPNLDRNTSNTRDDKSKIVSLYIPQLMSNIPMGEKAEEKDVTINNSIIVQDSPKFKFDSKVTTNNYIIAPPLRVSNQEQPPLAEGETVEVECYYGDPKKIKYTTALTYESMRTSDRSRVYVKDKTDLNEPDKEYWVKMDSAEGQYQVMTNDGRGEVSKYEFLVDAKNGFVKITDYTGNEFWIKTREHTLFLKNKDNSYISISGANIKVHCSGTITLDSNHVAVTGSLHANGSLTTSSSNSNHHGH